MSLQLGSWRVDAIHKYDCVHGMRQLPDACVDVIIADPPYNLSHGKPMSNIELIDTPGGLWEKTNAEWDRFSFDDYWAFTEAWLTEAKRVLKPTGSIWTYGSYHNIGVINVLYQKLGIEILNEIVWYKRNATPNYTARRFCASHETILWGHVGDVDHRQYYFNYDLLRNSYFPEDQIKEPGLQMRSVWDIPNNKTEEETMFVKQYGKHPTQKPLRICTRILMAASKPGDVVLVPFGGSGSECVAAKMMDRHFLAFELEDAYIALANARLAHEHKKGKNQTLSAFLKPK